MHELVFWSNFSWFGIPASLLVIVLDIMLKKNYKLLLSCIYKVNTSLYWIHVESVNVFLIFFLSCQCSHSLDMDHILPRHSSSHRDNWYSTSPDCAWTAAKGSISRTYMNVYGLLNCFRHTVRWALRLSKSNTFSQGQEGKWWEAVTVHG